MPSPSTCESDPTGRAPSTPGAKLDAGKPPLLRGVLQYFPRALQAVAEVSAHGAAKYTWKGWETVPDGVARYGDALARHLVKEAAGPLDQDSGLLHAAHAAWNALARLELILREQEAVKLARPPATVAQDADEIPTQHQSAPVEDQARFHLCDSCMKAGRSCPVHPQRSVGCCMEYRPRA
jgi:hypothetical protein